MGYVLRTGKMGEGNVSGFEGNTLMLDEICLKREFLTVLCCSERDTGCWKESYIKLAQSKATLSHSEGKTRSRSYCSVLNQGNSSSMMRVQVR